uniref:Short transient receptor potential channel 4-like n=1 Tax=Saccoglossus kowalevskii TaxID=10224 RepID=A0ABM0M1H5_SACKO|nr:PREDICTED: short transient receptor potential channel 4-like [Saccoglossus kowalevskii]
MSYMTFLVLLFATTIAENNAAADCTALHTDKKDVLKCLKVAELAQQQRGPPPSILEWIIVLWIVGMTWREIKELWSGGIAAYLRDPYNFIDWSQLALYWAVIALRIVAYLQVNDYIPNFATADGSIISVSKRQTTDDFVRQQHNGTRVFTEEQIASIASDIIRNLSSEMQISHERLEESIITLGNAIGQIITPETLSNVTTTQDNDIDFEFSFLDDWYDEIWWQEDSFFHEFQDDLSYIIPRSQWNQWDPTLIANCIFAVANVLSVLRILRLTVISQKIGPMQITLQKIVLDIFKFLFIFFCAWTAFSLGLTQIYWSYNAEAEVQCYQTPNATDCDKQPFGSVVSSMATLFWSLFDLTDLTDLNVKADHQSSEGFGRFLYAMYMIIAVIVLLNLLIAIMSNTYSKVQDNADIEWKFYRAEMWVGYFQEGGTLPVPFNIIPSPKSAFYFLKSIFCCTPCRRNPKKTVHQLVERYFARRQYVNRHHDSNPLTLSEFKEFRDEMTSFRKNVQDITTDVMNRISQLEGSLQKTGSVPLPAYDVSKVNEDGYTKSRYKTLKQRMVEQKLQIMGAESTPENIRHRNPKDLHSETTSIHTISHDTMARFSQAGQFGTQLGIRNPIFNEDDIELEIRQ